MNIIKRLPLHLAQHVYSYDDTYKKKLKSIINIFKYINLKTYYYEFTDYPDIYCNTYWGNFSLRRREKYLKTKFKTLIVYNRNRFIKEYNIVKCKTPRRNLIDEILNDNYTDHNEYYQDKDGNYIHLFSTHPYDDMEIYKDYTIIYPLYHEYQTTFIKYLPRLKPKKTKQIKTKNK